MVEGPPHGVKFFNEREGDIETQRLIYLHLGHGDCRP
jgi:hypothetical protein